MNNQPKIMSVDDEPFNHEVLREILENDFELVCVNSGKESLAIAEDISPDVILMDASMPDLNGYETCSQLKQKDLEAPILFVSAKDRLDERLKAYDSGGDDFIAKPFQPEELLSKIRSILKTYHNKKELKQQAEEASEMAMNAINYSSELSTVVHFVEDAYDCEDLNHLMDLITNILQQFDLICCTEIRFRSEFIYKAACDSGVVKPLEKDLFRTLRNRGRIFEFNKRMIINFEYISLLIKNMPTDDELHGRLRDHLCIVLGAASKMIQSFSMDEALKKQHEIIGKSATKLKHMFREHESKTLHIMDHLLTNMNKGINFLLMTEDQEQYFVDMLDQSMAELMDVYSDGHRIDACFSAMMDNITEFIESETTHKHS